MGNLAERKFLEALEVFLNKMENEKLIQGKTERDAVAQKLIAAFHDKTGVFKGDPAPAHIFTDPVQQKKLLLLVLCAKAESKLTPNLDPRIQDAVNTEKMAKALFDPAHNSQEDKLRISRFAAAIMLLQPHPGNVKNKAEDIAESIMQQKDRLENNDESAQAQDANRALNMKLFNSLLADFYEQQEYKYQQAFGSGFDGSPAPLFIQLGNYIASPDITSGAEKPTPGYQNMDRDTTLRKNLDPQVREEIEEKNVAALGKLETFDAGMQDTVREMRLPNAPAPTGPGATAK